MNQTFGVADLGLSLIAQLVVNVLTEHFSSLLSDKQSSQEGKLEP